MTVEEETRILKEINRVTTTKGRLLYSYEINGILDQFIIKPEDKTE